MTVLLLMFKNPKCEFRLPPDRACYIFLFLFLVMNPYLCQSGCFLALCTQICHQEAVPYLNLPCLFLKALINSCFLTWHVLLTCGGYFDMTSKAISNSLPGKTSQIFFSEKKNIWVCYFISAVFCRAWYWLSDEARLWDVRKLETSLGKVCVFLESSLIDNSRALKDRISKALAIT